MDIRHAQKSSCPDCGLAVFVQTEVVDGQQRFSHQTPTCDGFRARLQRLLGKQPVVESRNRVVVISAKPEGEA